MSRRWRFRRHLLLLLLLRPHHLRRRRLPRHLRRRRLPLHLRRAPSVFSEACSGFYPSSFQLSTAKNVDATPPLGKPTKGAAFGDPTYGTCVVRATDHVAEARTDFVRNDYSRRQAFNADSSRFIVYADGGTWHMYDAKTLAYIKQLPGPAGDAEPQWHPTNADLCTTCPAMASA